MKLSCKNIRPCTIFNNATQQNTYFKCYTITQPLAKLSHINLNLESKPFRNIEHLLFQNGDIDFTHPISSLPPPRPPPLSSDIDQRWMDYQGIQNWEGLLDPLDDNLRAEIIRYGHFVEAAYRACDFDPSSFSFSKCLYSKRKLLNQCGLPKSGYQVSRNLVATSGIQMPGWIEKVPSWMATQSSWIGYVAVCHDKREISRLGRRDVVIAFRGTATCLEWLENLRANLTSLPNYNSSNGYKNNNDGPMVESGFLSLYTSKLGTRPSLQDLVQQEVGKILETYGQQQHEQLSFTITGHSLGAALATLVAYDIKQTFKIAPLVTVISFGGPRVGNTSFRSCLETQGTKILRIVNSDDLITKVPGFVIDNKRINTSKTGINNQEHRMANFSSWIQRRIEDTQWVYADIGCELKLSSKDSPYDLNGLNIATCHELKTYLHLVNGFRSSHCPFKETARRIMNKPPMQKA
ncbi:hypothetical protein Leryth_027111 [Lithospermum erythrorhizon]|nr:hypothetical protein Leryth_027111 [Lithospermum erythrorhizon]